MFTEEIPIGGGSSKSDHLIPMPPIRPITSDTNLDQTPGSSLNCGESFSSNPVRLDPPHKFRKQFIIRICLFLACIVLIPLDSYRQGLNFGTISAFSSTMLLIWALPILFVRILFTVGRMIKYQISRKLPLQHLWILLFFPLACIIPSRLPSLCLADGVTQTLRKLNQSKQMIAAVAKELGAFKEQAGFREEYKERNARLLATPPFSSLDLKYTDLRILDNSQLFEFGGPLAFRWGFSVSAIQGQPPALPENCFNIRSVSKEIVVFEGPAD